MATNKIAKSKWEQMIFSKFRGIEYKSGELYLPRSEDEIIAKIKSEDKLDYYKYIANYYLYDILYYSRLYILDFRGFNDIDDCRYSIYNIKDKEKANDIAKSIRSEKCNRGICSFACFDNGAKHDDLLWTHYANSHSGVKIDFKIAPCYEGEVYRVRYSNEPPSYNIEDIQGGMIDNELLYKIMTTKKVCFRYEHEYRAINYKGNSYLPIIITKITLGKRISSNEIANDDIESGDFDDNVKRVADYILEIWKEGKKERSGDGRECLESRDINKPEIYAYKSMYSKEAKRVLLNKWRSGING